MWKSLDIWLMSPSWKADTKTKEFWENRDNTGRQINYIHEIMECHNDERIKAALGNEKYDCWNKKLIEGVEGEDKEIPQEIHGRNDIEMGNRRKS